ncbi:MAG TPA: helix-turn-helix domain-containing protein [Myxococcales bacterium]|nr:helix-turn-helix domain-containing protein [Myxococcales bacterium]
MARHSTQICAKFQEALDLLAKRWTGQIIQALLEGPMRYGELSAYIEVVGDKMLAERLKELEENGIVERRVIAKPIGTEYALTKKGQGLSRVFGAMGKWAEEWLGEDPAASKARNAR